MKELPQKVLIREVGPRDGLQIEELYVPTKDKIRLIKALVDAGLKAIEATSFVRPEAVPQFKDAEEMCAKLDLGKDVVYSALVGNARGVERALKAGIEEMVCVISASEAHNRRNVNMTINRSLEQLKEIGALVKGTEAVLRGAVATTFGCPYQGEISLKEISTVVEGLLQTGIEQINLADTAGLANPKQIFSVLEQVKNLYPDVRWGLHLHDSRGTAMANALAGLEAGVDILESSVGGAGGCPFIPKAAGNIPTEDLVYMLHSMGISTGIDLDNLLQSARMLEEILG